MKETLFSLLFLTAGAYAQTAPPAQPKLTPQEIQQINEQIGAAKKEISIKINVVENYLKIGHLYSRIDNVDQAQAAFESALSLDPKNARAHFMLGLIFEKKKLTAQAIHHWQQCQSNTTNPEIKKIAQKHLDYLTRK
ncbi:MAG: hypothetical protein COT17_02115 [Elusimicrobia bacterium CG08_land_8_20_14_0_20_51_18]|nr:MAG: hypothetical protein COT17_02115 [Elusimicrobia bacterium CG08_land_8_20_14_0_20_51_18]